MYKIAEYLTQEQKERACAAEYSNLRAHVRRTDDWYCPLGLAYLAPTKAPTAQCIANDLHEAVGGDSFAIYRAARRFIHDWDRGRITDLRRALGCK